MCRVYFLMQALQSTYAMVPVEKIEYHHQGRFRPISDMVRMKALKHNQIHVRYENGLDIHVNGSPDEDSRWPVRVGGTSYEPPSGGFVAHLPGKLLEYGALVGGHRVDFVDGPTYLYADGRGRLTDFGLVRTKGQVIVRKSAEGGCVCPPRRRW